MAVRYRHDRRDPERGDPRGARLTHAPAYPAKPATRRELLVHREGEVAPHNFTMTPFGEAASQLAPWSVVWDFRQMGETLYRDVVDAYDAAARRLEPGAARPVALVHPGREADVEDAFREFRYHGKLAPVPRIVPAEARPIATRSFDLLRRSFGGTARRRPSLGLPAMRPKRWGSLMRSWLMTNITAAWKG
jgi:hypothetical protein